MPKLRLGWVSCSSSSVKLAAEFSHGTACYSSGDPANHCANIALNGLANGRPSDPATHGSQFFCNGMVLMGFGLLGCVLLWIGLVGKIAIALRILIGMLVGIAHDFDW
jgi:hypothetical protein